MGDAPTRYGGAVSVPMSAMEARQLSRHLADEHIHPILDAGLTDDVGPETTSVDGGSAPDPRLHPAFEPAPDVEVLIDAPRHREARPLPAAGQAGHHWAMARIEEGALIDLPRRIRPVRGDNAGKGGGPCQGERQGPSDARFWDAEGASAAGSVCFEGCRCSISQGDVTDRLGRWLKRRDKTNVKSCISICEGQSWLRG